MKKILIPALLVAAVWSCSPKSGKQISQDNKTNTEAASTTTVTGDNKTATTETPAISSVKTPSAAVTAGEATYKSSCGRCHGLKNASSYTSAQWTKIVDRMAVKARLSDDEKANVLAYVNFYAKEG